MIAYVTLMTQCHVRPATKIHLIIFGTHPSVYALLDQSRSSKGAVNYYLRGGRSFTARRAGKNRDRPPRRHYNVLPEPIRSRENLEGFKSAMKTFLFKEAYGV